MSNVDTEELERMFAEKLDKNMIIWILQRIFLCYITFYTSELNLKTSEFLNDSIIEKLRDKIKIKFSQPLEMLRRVPQ